MDSDFSVMVRAKFGDMGSMKKLWNTYFRNRQDGDSALLLVRMIEGFDPGKVADQAGWKFSELFAEVKA
jgi:hypothetical protein